jgi:predicted nuclease of predicted toxin-antitoxin system
MHLSMHEASELEIWSYALRNNFIIVSKMTISDNSVRSGAHHQLSALRGAPPKVPCLDVGNCLTAFVTDLLRHNLLAINEFVLDEVAALLVFTRERGN